MSTAQPRRKVPLWPLLTLLAIGTALLVIFSKQWPIMTPLLETFILPIENSYHQWFDQQQVSHPYLLLPLALIGGLIASVSPCILGLLPVNLSYIGTLELKSRWDAFWQASWFVLGAATVLSVMGLFASLAAAIFVEWRGYVNLLVGLIIIVMGASFAGWVKLPLPSRSIEFPIPGSYGVGITFALVTSPCASPVLFAILSAAAATGSQIVSVLAMICYAIGYTAVIFLASLFTGIVKQSRVLLAHADRVVQIGSLVLILAGVYYATDGILWFFS
jgi:cytochrome c-type biogenesis protein